MDGGTRIRPTARVLLLDDHDRALLFRGRNDDAPSVRFWFPAGGGIEAGESPRDAAIREVWEETGAQVELGPHIWNRRHVVSFNGMVTDLRESWFLARVAAFDIDTSRFTKDEQHVIQEHRWWTVTELSSTPDLLVPRDLAALLRGLLDDGPPLSPLTVGV
ncbi:MAG: hypothetical protein QG661_1616 [Actinomycetota bacterium]|nr:hypothetical protein [Actinomycetota bacterium]